MCLKFRMCSLQFFWNTCSLQKTFQHLRNLPQDDYWWIFPRPKTCPRTLHCRATFRGHELWFQVRCQDNRSQSHILRQKSPWPWPNTTGSIWFSSHLTTLIFSIVHWYFPCAVFHYKSKQKPCFVPILPKLFCQIKVGSSSTHK